MDMTKPTADLGNWIALPDRENPTHFVGAVANHTRQDEFHADVQRTSQVIEVDYVKGLLETRNTIYRLGKPAHIL